MFKQTHFLCLFIILIITAQIDAQSSTEHFNRGNSFYQQKLYKEAVDEYTKAIAINKMDIDAYNNRGIARYNIGQFNEAINDFSVVISAEPDDIFAYQSRAITYSTIGNHQKAFDDYQAVIKRNPNFAYSYFASFYTLYYISKSDFRKLYQAFKKNQISFPDREWPSTIIGYISKKINKKSFIKKAGNDNEKLCEAYFTIGFDYLRKKRNKKAMLYFSKCIATDMFESMEYRLAKAELNKLNKKYPVL